jgi:2-polyprenyl-3-methyl-5-hydroxy-6-metoxy-1,4-benzoquinol methylase
MYRKTWSRRGLKYFDHHFDHLRGPGYIYWQERGILGNRAIPHGGIALDLCCGDGFYSTHYYSLRAAHVDAVDLDESAIRVAKRAGRGNVAFKSGDVLAEEFPRAHYDTVLFFSGLQQIPAEHRSALLRKIAASLKPNGRLLGSALPIEDLEQCLSACFRGVNLWISEWPGRDEVYFDCHEPL